MDAPSLTVVDAMMGAGKTEWAAAEMLDMLARGQRFIYITPYKKEIVRITGDKTKPGKLPPGSVEVPMPKGKNGTKMPAFRKAVTSGRSIVATHKLFEHVTEDTVETIKKKGYVLIIDEVCDWV